MTQLLNHPSMATGTYFGDQLDKKGTPLKGQRALIMSGSGENFKVQFERLSTGYAYGWVEFPSVCFTLDARFSVVDDEGKEQL